MGELILILGGARSGKSSFAEHLAGDRGGDVLYIATAEALDDEMEERIQIHREQRPAHWETREVPRRIAASLKEHAPDADTILMDCVTLLVSNLLLAASESEEDPDRLEAESALDLELGALISYIKEKDLDWLLVSNEVGMGLVPPYPLGRLYRDLLGKANRRLASVADEVYFLSAGMVLPLHTLGSHIDHLQLKPHPEGDILLENRE